MEDRVAETGQPIPPVGRARMTREEFKRVFEQALEAAARVVEERYLVTIPRNFEIELHGLGHSGDTFDVDSALDEIYLGDDLFLFLIDVAVKRADPKVTRVYLGVTGHPPRATFEETWNQPPGSGPFKQIISLQFRFFPGS